MFDLAVNGGGYLTVNYRKEGYMPVQRQVNAPWNDFAWLADVILLPFDNQVRDTAVTDIPLTALLIYPILVGVHPG